jgi:hypothetical protein
VYWERGTVLRYLCAATLAIAVACGRAGSEGWVAETSTSGDTTTVHTRSGQLWPSAREAVVDLAIGSLNTPETSFGFVAAVAVNRDGDVFVYDWQVPVIRQFNAQGEFVRQIGKAGRGPGEYNKPIFGLAVRSDGRLQVGDIANSRITLYSPDGTLSDTWKVVPPGVFPSQSMLVGEGDNTYIRLLTGVNSFNVYTGALLRVGPNGTVTDTLREPELRNPAAGDGLFGAAKVAAVAHDGSIVAGVNDRYEFAVHRSDGRVTRVLRDKPVVRIGDEEHAALEAWRVYLAGLTEELEGAGSRRGGVSTSGERVVVTGPPIQGQTPREKPVYRSLHVTESGNIWVRLYAEGKRKADFEPAPAGAAPVSPYFEPTLYDVFDNGGRYLGEVHVPDNVTVLLIGDTVLWGWRLGEMGEPQVVRMTVDHARQDR